MLFASDSLVCRQRTICSLSCCLRWARRLWYRAIQSIDLTARPGIRVLLTAKQANAVDSEGRFPGRSSIIGDGWANSQGQIGKTGNYDGYLTGWSVRALA